MKRLQKGEICSNTLKLTFTEGKFQIGVCNAPAVTFRKGWRFGNQDKGEPVTVDVRFPLCADCARAADEAEAENAAEAAVS